MTQSKKSTFIASGIIFLLAFIVYANSFRASFHFDDFYTIVENDRIKNIQDLRSILSVNPSRPLVFLTLAVNYYFGRLDTFGYHIVNFAFHVLNGFLVYAVSLGLFGTKEEKRGASIRHILANRWSALFPALIFVSHPMQTEAVTYIIQRSSTMCATFYLLALYLFMETAKSGRRSPWWIAGAAASFIFSYLSKEEAATLPAIVLLYDYIFVSGRDINRLRARVWYHLPFWVLLALSFAYRHALYNTFFNPVKVYPVSVYIYTELTVILKYLQLLIFPVNQNIDHDYPGFATLWSFWPLLSLAVHIGLVSWAVWKIRLERVLCFSILWFYITLIPTSSIIPLQDFMAEHRVYLSSVGFCIGLGIMLQRASLTVPKSWRIMFPGPARTRA